MSRSSVYCQAVVILKVQRLIELMGISAIYPKKLRSSLLAEGNRIYLYLLRGLTIERPSQVWCADICYIHMARGFLHLVAILDCYSRKVLT